MHIFPKSEKLKSKKKIAELFLQKNFFMHDEIKLYWRVNNADEHHKKIVIIVPKKKIVKAVDRNKIKRYLRESYRINKSILDLENKQINIGFVYLSSKISDFKAIERKIKLILLRLREEICRN